MKYIISSYPKEVSYDESVIERIESKLKDSLPITEDETSILLDYICYQTRSKLSNNIREEAFDGKDLVATSMINDYFNNLGVTTHACNTKLNIDEDVVNNNFLVIEINTDLYGNSITIPYLIDVTFRQFLTREKCHKDYAVMKDGLYIRKPDPGHYIHPLDFEEVNAFVRDGYALFDPEFSSIYGNLFLNTKLYTHNDNYLRSDYFQFYDNFLKGSDIKLLNHNFLEKEGFVINQIQGKMKKM